jgi:hypothetical protein
MSLLYLGKLQLTTSWQPYKVRDTASIIEMTGTKQWSWCTNIDSGAFRSVPAFQREVMISSFRTLPIGVTLFYFKGDENGDIYEKLTY